MEATVVYLGYSAKLVLSWPLKLFEKYSYIGSLVKGIRENTFNIPGAYPKP